MKPSSWITYTIWPSVILLMALTDIDTPMPPLQPDERYGWLLPIGLAVFLIPTWICGFLAGKEHKNMTTQPIKFEKGKFYCSRNGKKWQLIHVFVNRPACPFMFVNETDHILIREDGLYMTKESDYDILSEWHDDPVVDWSKMPVWANWIAQDFKGAWFWYANKPEILGTIWVPKDYSHYSFGQIPKQYEPHTFSGDWKESLCRRPT